MLGHHVLGAEGTDFHHPGSSLLGVLAFWDTVSCALGTLPPHGRWRQTSEL